MPGQAGGDPENPDVLLEQFLLRKMDDPTLEFEKWVCAYPEQAGRLTELWREVERFVAWARRQQP